MSPPPSESAAGLDESGLATLERIARSAGQIELAAEIAATSRALARGELTVAVLGQFKRGKSSLLNALAGRPAFPTGILPTTAVATYLVRGPVAVRVTESDGTVHVVPGDAVEEYVSEQKNPSNRRRILRVEVAAPLPDWADGVTFVDSPGIGSAHGSNTEAARALLPRVDAAIFVLSPDPPITSDEVAFLAEVSEYAAKFFFVLNKVDLVSSSERAELLGYLDRVLRERCGFDAVRIFPISTRHARSGPGTAARPEASDALRGLWEALREVLGPGRAQAVQEVARARTRRFADKLHDLLALAVRSSLLSDEERDRRLAGVDRGVAEVRSEFQATRAWLGEAVDALVERLPPRLAVLRQAEIPAVVAALRARLETLSGRTGGGFVRAYESEFRSLVAPAVARIRGHVTDEVVAELARVSRTFEERMARWTAALAENVAREFGIDVPRLSVEPALVDSRGSSARIEGLYEGTFVGQTVLLLPPSLLRRRLRARVAETVGDEFEAQTGRIRSDLAERVARSWRAIHEGMGAGLEANVRLIEEAVAAGRASHRAGRESAERWRGEMDRLRTRVAGLGAGSEAAEVAG